MKNLKVDLCVIGAGSGGLSVAAGAVQMGAKVALIEGHLMGGDCLNYGCVPSKALLAAGAEAYHSGQVADYAAAKDRVAAVIAKIEPHDSQARFEGLGVTVIRAMGRFVSPTELVAGDTTITARRFVIATGSKPLVPPIPGLADVPYLTNETLFALREKPDHLLIIGGGPIGIEMAQAHRRLGCQVTVIEAAKALGKDDPELAAIVLDRLRTEGVVIREQVAVTHVAGGAGAVTLTLGDGTTVTGSRLLVAVGRKANLDLGLEAAGVATERGIITVDARLRTSNRRIFAIGDVAGRLQFTHVAGYHAGIVIRQALLGLKASASTRAVPWVTYTDPELAQVGLTEAEARTRHGDRLTVVRFPYDGIDRAVATGKTVGLIKVMVVRGKPVGASIAGAEAGELIALWAMAIANNLPISAIANTILPYPTLNEVSKRAAGAYFSPKLFDSPMVKRVVRFVQNWLP
jgi:pyruvate/2-oxoglutarate dehydrogenase complex dihydrolipoamide dehydrogenase (E3) component